MSLNFIEVCAGCGGLSQGFIKAGFTPLLLNDNDTTCCNTLKANHKDVTVICDDMNKLDLNEYKDRVDVLMGGIPCQSFSQSGKRMGLEDKRGNLMLTFKTLLLQVNPKVFLIENVKGLVTHNGGDTLQIVIDNLNNDDEYTITYQVLNAVDFEVPQKRERVIIVGVRKDITAMFKFPDKINKRLVLKDVLIDCPDSDGYKYPDKKKRVMELVPQGGCWINLPEQIQKEYMGKSIDSGGGKRGMARRLSMNEPCLTLTTSPCQKQTERCHPLETRPLNIREYARIQTFADDYVFTGSIAKQYRQIGNAVPVKLAYHIGMSVKELLMQQ
jgi:DNA (cytosine-5)-methyltransferase 1